MACAAAFASPRTVTPTARAQLSRGPGVPPAPGLLLPCLPPSLNTRPLPNPPSTPQQQQVRAGSLQELVYKQGSAGVTRATVSIVFHNDDPATGPAGYEEKELITVTRQVVIGGRDKYLINGHAAQQG
jgi:hypothetical protein